ncbi:MAG: hypothetical protein K0U61_04710 [Alphaproteobacteria bacterium]|nr:hypothetical protein [Alphaproteobacteria bacterium]
MNRLSPLTLPRFDVKALSRTARTLETHTQAPEGQSDFTPDPDSTPQTEVQAEPIAPDLNAPIIPEPDPVDTGVLLSSLEQSLGELERNATLTCHQALADFFVAAYPRLNEAFLAAEISKALETMAPPKIQRLNLQVPSTLEASFRQSLQASPRLSEICELTPTDSPDRVLVEADWGEGGLSFDMDQFLNSSLGRLSGPENT